MYGGHSFRTFRNHSGSLLLLMAAKILIRNGSEEFNFARKKKAAATPGDHERIYVSIIDSFVTTGRESVSFLVVVWVISLVIFVRKLSGTF